MFGEGVKQGYSYTLRLWFSLQPINLGQIRAIFEREETGHRRKIHSPGFVIPVVSQKHVFHSGN